MIFATRNKTSTNRLNIHEKHHVWISRTKDVAAYSMLVSFCKLCAQTPRICGNNVIAYDALNEEKEVVL